MKTRFFTLFMVLMSCVGTSFAAIKVRLDPRSCSTWENVYLWAWTSNGNVFYSWPGKKIDIDYEGWYSYEFEEDIDLVNIIWSNGNNQTVDITNISESTCFALTGDITTLRVVSHVVDCLPPSAIKVSLHSTNGCFGENVYLWAWTSNGNVFDSWPGKKIDIDYDGCYSYEFDADIDLVNIIWSDGYIQTQDITNISTSTCFDLHCAKPDDRPTPKTITGASFPCYTGFHGKCGDNLRWGYFDGVLMINGKGAMDNYNIAREVPWFSARNNIKSVIINEDVTSIGDFAFSNCSSLTSITIPNSVKSIGTAAFNSCSGLTSVTIPNSVKSIGDNAFKNCSGLTSVTIGNSVTSIGGAAFQWCSGLTSVTIGNSVTSIGHEAFYYCSGLTSVTIPNSVTSIGYCAFDGCSGLTSVTIPNSVTSIEIWAFNNCSSLTSPVYNAHCFAYMPTSYKGAYIIPEGIKQIAGGAFYGCSGLTSVTIPNSVTSIGKRAFQWCSSLTSITIPNSVKSIGEEAFLGCSGLTSVTIPNSVKSIGGGAFRSCSGLTSITIPNSVTTIENSAFEDCTKLTSITIPNSVTTIGHYAFDGCSGLTSVTIPNSVTSIGHCAFRSCSGLTSVTIGNSVTSIGDGAFRSCSGLTSVTIPNSVTSIGHCAFYNCSGLTSPVYNAHRFAYMPTSYKRAYIIPEGIKQIAGGAFADCSGLTSVTIPNSVTSIGDDAFYNCSGLTAVTCKGVVPPTLENSVFKFVHNNIPLYVPCESLSDYQSDARWSYFTNIQCLSDAPSAVENTHSQSSITNTQRLLLDGQLLILHNGKTYNTQGAMVY